MAKNNPLLSRQINVNQSLISKRTPQVQPKSAIRARGKAVVEKQNHIKKVQKALQPKNIRTKPLAAYSKIPKRAVVQKLDPIHKQLESRRQPKPERKIEKIRNRRMVRQHVDKPRRSIAEGAHKHHAEKARTIKDVGANRILIILAAGPSVLEAPLELIADHKLIDFMAINRPYGFYKDQVPSEHVKIWPTKYWAFCDHSQYKRNTSAWESYKGTLINSPAVRNHHQNQLIIRNRPGKGFSRDMTLGYHIGRSSTYANMQVAYWMGYKQIYIFGLDMCAVDGKLHHYGKNPDVAEENRLKRFNAEAEHYTTAVQGMTKSERSKFIICSSYNKFKFVDSLERLDQKEAPKIILERAEGLVKNNG